MQTLPGPDVPWRPVSSALPSARTFAIGLVAGLPAAIVCGVLWLLAPAAVALVVTAVALVVLGWLVWVARRNARTWSYYEGADELLVRSGRLVQKIVTIPYGRMQLVDLASTPFGRRYGIATVQLHTAAATSHARIVGLPREEAESLRQRLVERGQAHTEGL
jgi:membrane protein YdbS with pleckstrin-like domain